MIRPITLITALMASLSGLYLYYAKNAVLMLDRRIEKIARDTTTITDHTRLLHAEWTLLNDPERLRQFSDRYLALKPLAPPQFTTMADLAGRLPPPRAPEPEPAPIQAPAGGSPLMGQPVTDITSAEPRATEEPAAVIVAEEVLPLPPQMVPPPPFVAQPATAAIAAAPRLAPPVQAAPPIQMAAPRPEAPAIRPPLQAQADPRPAPRPAEVRPTETRTTETRPAETRVASAPRPPLQAGASPQTQPPRPVAPGTGTPTAQGTGTPMAPGTGAPMMQASTQPTPRPYVAPAARPQPAPPASAYQPVSAPVNNSGSMLGGAQRGVPVPLPRPTPYLAPVHDGGG